MRVCSKCHQEKLLEDFAINRSKKGKNGRAVQCKKCHCKYQKEWFLKNKEKQYARVKKNRIAAVRKSRNVILNYLKDKRCVDCGILNIIVLQFDHVRGEKEANIADLVKRGNCSKSLLEEIEKCDVVCANCHTIRTAKRGNWYRIVGVT